MKDFLRRWVLYWAVITAMVKPSNTSEPCIISLKFQLTIIDKTLGSLVYTNFGIQHICSQAFIGLNDLEQLHLSWNHLTILPTDLFRPIKNIQLIYLDGNNLTSISFDEFSNNRKLQMLSLKNNKIQNFEPIQHKGEFSLSKLWLEKNNLIDISALCKLTKLEELSLSDNPGIDVGTFKPNCWNELRYLDLRNIGLKRLKNDYRSFTGLTKLTWLFLPHNNFEVFCAGNFPELPALVELDVANNQLQSLDENELKHKFPKLSAVRLAGNNWSCEYYNVLEADLKNKRITILHHVSEANCDDRQINKKPTSNLEQCIIQNELNWPPPTQQLVFWSFLIVDSFLMIAAIILGYHYYLHREVSKDVGFY